LDEWTVPFEAYGTINGWHPTNSMFRAEPHLKELHTFGMQSTSMARLEIDRPSQGPALAVLQAQHAICSSFEQSALSHYNITATANVMMLND